jgi:hypothetical protein
LIARKHPPASAGHDEAKPRGVELTLSTGDRHRCEPRGGEKAGLVTRRTIGRTHWIEPKIERVRLVEHWFKELKSIWELRLEKLDEILKDGGTEND